MRPRRRRRLRDALRRRGARRRRHRRAAGVDRRTYAHADGGVLRGEHTALASRAGAGARDGAELDHALEMRHVAGAAWAGRLPESAHAPREPREARDDVEAAAARSFVHGYLRAGSP